MEDDEGGRGWPIGNLHRRGTSKRRGRGTGEENRKTIEGREKEDEGYRGEDQR